LSEQTKESIVSAKLHVNMVREYDISRHPKHFEKIESKWRDINPAKIVTELDQIKLDRLLH